MEYFLKLITIQILFIFVTCQSLDIDSLPICDNSTRCYELTNNVCQDCLKCPCKLSNLIQNPIATLATKTQTSTSKNGSNDSQNKGLIAGLVVGLTMLLILVIITIVVLYIFRKKICNKKAGPKNLINNELAQNNLGLNETQDNANIATPTSNTDNLNYIEIEIVTDKQSSLPTYNSLFS